MPDTIRLIRRDLGSGITLAEALSKAAGELAGAVALLYTPHECRLARFHTGALRDREGSAIAIVDNAFEARIFNETCELRWLQAAMDGATRVGRAALIGEGIAGGAVVEAEPLPRSYIVWGQGDGINQAGWSLVSTARIGPLWLPIDGIGAREMVEVTACEYIARDSETGNAYIADERLTGLRRYGETNNA
jgi:CRISPR-associated protein (TIGR03984 family)